MVGSVVFRPQPQNEGRQNKYDDPLFFRRKDR